jgi:hypothetical protein
VLFPDWWGEPSARQVSGPVTDITSQIAVEVNYNERTFYPGAVGLLLALVALAGRGGWRRKAPFAVLGFLGLAIPLHFPGLYQLVIHLPAFELVQNQRLHFVFALAVAVLAAFGLQAVLERPAGDRWRLGVGVAALLIGVGAFVGVGASGSDVSDTVTHFLSGTEFESAGVLALSSVVWYLLFAVGVGVALVAARRWPSRVVAIGGTLVALAAFDMLHFAHGYQPMGPASVMIPPRTGAIEFLQERRDQGRILGLQNTLVNDWSLTYGLNDIRGYDPPQPTLRFYRLWRLANPQQLNWTSFSMELSLDALQVASVLGARWIVMNPGVELPLVNGGGPLSALQRAYELSDATIFENRRAAPRVMAVAGSAVHVTRGEAETRTTLIDAGFDPRHEVVVERGEPDVAAVAASSSGGEGADGGGAVAGTARVAADDGDRVVVNASLSRRALVVLNDNLTDGWSVKVDGRDADVVRVNDVMRGVVVPAGRHAVAWSYRVPGLRVGLGLSLIAVIGMLGVGAIVAGTRRRGPRRMRGAAR